jgi:hypothetical protein
MLLYISNNRLSSVSNQILANFDAAINAGAFMVLTCLIKTI